MNNSVPPVKRQSNIFYRWLNYGKNFADKAANILYPSTCIHCSTPISNSQSLCALCWSDLRPITEPFCPILGLPFDIDMGANTLSASAISNPPIFDRARSAFIYSDISLSIISKLKYADRPDLAKYCAQLMANILAPILEGNPILVPVPLHWTRQFNRRYNQASEIARHLAKICNLQMELTLVKRTKRTKRQVGLSAKERRKNITNAFSVNPDALNIAQSNRIILVDDVITTGATLNEIAKTLKKAGIEKIDVISFARVLNNMHI